MFSIVICTYNRSYLLKEQLVALKMQETPAHHDVEILYVDNNSTDGTAELIESAVEAVEDFPFSIRVIREIKQGLSHARNRGFEEARGEYVIYLDDDAFPVPGWLAAYAEALSTWQPEVAGGPIIPFSKQPLPKWLDIKRRELAGYVVYVDYGRETRFLSYNDEVWGANMSFKKSTLETLGCFNTLLGVNGKRRFGSEESELQNRIRAAGGRVLYVEGASVHHLIVTQKLGILYFLRQHYERGISEAKVEMLAKQAKRSCVGYWRVRRIAQSAFSALVAFGRGRTTTGVIHLQSCATHLGQVTQLLSKP